MIRTKDVNMQRLLGNDLLDKDYENIITNLPANEFTPEVIKFIMGLVFQ